MAQEAPTSTERTFIQEDVPYGIRRAGNTLVEGGVGATHAVGGGALSIMAAPAAMAPATAMNVVPAARGLLKTLWNPFKAAGHLAKETLSLPFKALDATWKSLKNPGGVVGRIRGKVNDLMENPPFSETAKLLTEGPVELGGAVRRSFITPYTRGICDETETVKASTGFGGMLSATRAGISRLFKARQTSLAITPA